jgi:hypothetical protein
MDQLDAAVAAACKNRAPTTPSNDRVLYFGLNETSADGEAAALARRTQVTRIRASADTRVELQGVSFDLATASGPPAFAEALAVAHGMTAEQARALAGILIRTGEPGRDELARLALAWAPAELGRAIPSRLVLSGHSAGGYLWGQHASLRYADVRALAAVFPTAARQVEDVHISGCFSEHEVANAARWTAAFPNLKTLWAYREFCPSGVGAARHLADWEVATRGRTARLDEALVASHPTATAWSLAGGIAATKLPLEERRARAAAADTRFDAYTSGERRIPNAHDPIADRDYAAYRLLAASSEAPRADREEASRRAEALLRLRFYEQSVRGKLARADGSAIDAALTRLGLPPANLAELSRRDVLTLARTARDHAPASPDPVVRRGLALLDGIVELRADVIPASYCQ